MRNLVEKYKLQPRQFSGPTTSGFVKAVANRRGSNLGLMQLAKLCISGLCGGVLIAGLANAEAADVFRRSHTTNSIGEIPIGGITMFYGKENELPENWRIANGQLVNDPDSPYHERRLPDLRETFVRGAADDDEVGNSGGRDERDTHTHTVDTGYWTVKARLCLGNENSEYCKDWSGLEFPIPMATNTAVLYGIPFDGYYALVRKSIDDEDAETDNQRDGVSWDKFTDLDNRPSYRAMHYIIRIK